VVAGVLALLGEKPTAGSLFRLALAMAGVLVVKTPESLWPIPSSLPDWLALAGGLSFALTNAHLRNWALSERAHGARMLAMFGGGTLLASGAALLGMSQACPGAGVVGCCAARWSSWSATPAP
jgi:drug/metabolite transporter (DMT)-like permease